MGHLQHRDTVVGPTSGNACQSYLVTGWLSVECRACPEWYGPMRSSRYSGPSLCTALCVRLSAFKMGSLLYWGASAAGTLKGLWLRFLVAPQWGGLTMAES